MCVFKCCCFGIVHSKPRDFGKLTRACILFLLMQQPTSPKHQIVAHDTEVYDIAFSSSDPKKFASVGGDGSLRLFDLR